MGSKIKYIVLLIFGFLWFLGCSKDVSKLLFDKGILADDYRYGDLYRLSNLSKFRVLTDKCKDKIEPKTSNYAVFLAGDSFTEPGRIDANDFISTKYYYGLVAKPNKSLPRFSGKKILIIETVERHFRERFTQPWENWTYKKTKISNADFTFEDILAYKMPYDSELHEAVLFGSDFIMRIKEIKANINFYVFHKVDNQVKLSKNKQHLLYSLDVDAGVSSGFEAISDKEIDSLVANVNKTYLAYKKMGFDEVYLSIIPNKSSIIGKDLGVYNQLVRRIENHPNLKMPHLSVINEFDKEGAKAYAIGDSHWNCLGKQIWIDKVNAVLRNLK